MRPCFWVEKPERVVTLEQPDELLGGHHRHVAARIPGAAGKVTGGDDIVELQERVIWWRWFLAPDIDAGSRHLARFERPLECGLVADAATRRHDEIDARLHQREGAIVEQVQGLRRARAVDRDVIGLPKQVVERCFFAAAPLDLLARQVRVVREHTHVEGGSADLGDAPADMTEADNANGTANDLVAKKLRHRQKADATSQGPVVQEHALGECDHHRYGVFGDRFAIAARLIDDDDAGSRAGVDIDRIGTGAIHGNDEQVRHALQEIAGYVEPAGDHVAA